MTVYENHNYKVVVGDGVDYDTPCYLVVNKTWNVIEVESRLLPQAIIYADQLNDGLEEKDADDDEPQQKLVFNH